MDGGLRADLVGVLVVSSSTASAASAGAIKTAARSNSSNADLEHIEIVTKSELNKYFKNANNYKYNVFLFLSVKIALEIFTNVEVIA